MSKKIVIMPVFCEAHLIEYQIPNIIDTINPDYIVYNEGMFPKGPESTTNVSVEFIKNYTLDGKRGFDFELLEEIIKKAQKTYTNTRIILNKMDYSPHLTNASECYFQAVSNFKDFGIDIEEGDYIFPYEGDVFHLESSKNEIQGYLDQLQPNTGFKSNWIDFIENQYYCERSTLKPFIEKIEGRHRKICIRYGTEEFYRDVVLNFVSQKYPMLYPTDLVTYHYCWWRPGKYKQLRYDQLNRPSHYWQQFDQALNQIRELKEKEIVLRPDKPISSTARYASYWEIEHPKAVINHTNYINKDKNE